MGAVATYTSVVNRCFPVDRQPSKGVNGVGRREISLLATRLLRVLKQHLAISSTRRAYKKANAADPARANSAAVLVGGRVPAA